MRSEPVLVHASRDAAATIAEEYTSSPTGKAKVGWCESGGRKDGDDDAARADDNELGTW
jgi:hypothetical protein